MDASLILGTISGLKTAGDIAKSLLDLKSVAEVRGKVIELQSVILSAQSSALEANARQSALVEQMRTLKEEIANIKAWEKDKQRYAFVSPWSGFIVYAMKKESAGTEPPHWICTKCYEDRRKSILNQIQRTDKTFWKIVCPICKSENHSLYRSPYQPKYAEETIAE